MPVLEEGDEIVVTPRKAPVDPSATAKASSSTVVAPPTTITTASNEVSCRTVCQPTAVRETNNQQNEEATADDSSENAWSNQEKLELLKVREQLFYLDRDQQANYLHKEMSRFRRRDGEPERPKRSGHEITSMIRELAHDGVTIEDLEEAINPKPAKEKAKSSGC